MIFEEKAVSIGKFMVGRLLPFRQKRSVGPFVFIDHIGPALVSKEEPAEVLSHPHIGLSTLTFLFEGAMLHRDSIGTEIVIKPGAVNWMTAGKGVVHSERIPEEFWNGNRKMHGLQIWVAMPKDLEQSDPSFTHIEAGNIPQWEQDGVAIKLIAGEAFGRKSPVPVYSKLYFIEIKSNNAQILNLGEFLYGESGLYILEGKVSKDGIDYEPKRILITTEPDLCSFEIGADTTIYLFGGEPFPEERFIHWNFVSSSREMIEKAKEDWKAQRFPKVPKETDYVPLPE